MKTLIGVAGLTVTAVGVGTIITVQALQEAAHAIEEASELVATVDDELAAV